MRAKLVENNNFERGLNEPSDLGIGRWKEADDIVIPIHAFEKNGGILEKDREIYSNGPSGRLEGYYLDFDSNQNVHLMYNSRYKSIPIAPGYGVKVKTKVLYQ